MKYQDENERPVIIDWFVRLIFMLILLAVLIAAVFFVFILIADYRPERITPLPIGGQPVMGAAETGREYSIITYNIGYCRQPSAEGTEKKLIAMQKVLSGNSRAGKHDFIFIQEVDENSKRSFNINQRESFETRFRDNYMDTFAIDYKVPFALLSARESMGKVLSGIQIFSKVITESAERYAFDGEESFPLRLFGYDRCFMVVTIPVENGASLKLINAYFTESDGNEANKTEQLEQIKTFLLEQNPNDYIVLGGDWNAGKLPDKAAPEGYNWGVDAAFNGFLVSPNIEIISAKTDALHVEDSDNYPVVMKFMLKKDSE